MKYYLMGITDNIIGCGCAYCQIGGFKTMNRIKSQALQFKNCYSHDSIYLIYDNQYTQSACELSPNDFYDFIISKGLKVA